MEDGFSVLEVIIALALSLSIVSILLTNVSGSAVHSKKITGNQQVLESIFHTVDTIKLDLSKCGMRLQEAGTHFDIPMFEHTDRSFKITYGKSSDFLETNSYRGDKFINVKTNGSFEKKKSIIIYNQDREIFEFNGIEKVEGNRVSLIKTLKNDYFKSSAVVVLKQIEYKLYPKQKILKRKQDRGYFQPLMENVTDFFVTFFPESNSVLYRIEVNKKEQIRGYIFLTNMVKK